jgi:hypothetical protein
MRWSGSTWRWRRRNWKIESPAIGYRRRRRACPDGRRRPSPVAARRSDHGETRSSGSGGTRPLCVFLSRLVGATWALCMAWSLLRCRTRPPSRVHQRHECGTDPADILRPGELLEESTLRFIVAAHCAKARYLSDERIALRYGGAPVEVETRKLSVAGAPHYVILSVGGEGWAVTHFARALQCRCEHAGWPGCAPQRR